VDSLLTFLRPVLARCAQLGIAVDQEGLPDGVRRLLALATAVPARTGERRGGHRAPLLARVGDAVVARWTGWGEALASSVTRPCRCSRLVVGKARFRRSDYLLVLQDSGARTLPIVSLMSLLVGLILAFVGAIQLRLFGAQIYVAHLVGIGVVREIGAIMTGIVVTGRTGASFAAQLGTIRSTRRSTR
jgi:phospholipid/cholesterol/gamma-HCH transport system permease protein